MKDFE
jgi:hypothetical protein